MYKEKMYQGKNFYPNKKEILLRSYTNAFWSLTIFAELIDKSKFSFLVHISSM